VIHDWKGVIELPHDIKGIVILDVIYTKNNRDLISEHYKIVGSCKVVWKSQWVYFVQVIILRVICNFNYNNVFKFVVWDFKVI